MTQPSSMPKAAKGSTASDTKVDVWMPMYVSDFLTSTLGWSAEERGHFLTLLMAQWAMGGLPADPKALDRISPGLAKCWGMLSAKFRACEDGRLRNARLEEVREQSKELRWKRSQAAKVAARRRWGHADAGETAMPNGMPDACETHSDSHFVCDAASPSPSQVPPPPPRTRARGGASGPEPEPSGSDADWQKLRTAWNAGQGKPWKSKRPPDGLADRLAEPGWLEEMLEAILRIPRMRFYRASPPTLLQAIKPDWAPRANGGGYDDVSPPKHRAGSDDRPPVKVDPDWPRKKREAEEREARKRLRGVASVGDVLASKAKAMGA